MKKVTLLFLIFALHGKSFCSSLQDESLDSQQEVAQHVHTHFENHPEPAPSEIHFYWTSGVKRKDLREDPSSQKRFRIGGSKWGNEFPWKLKIFLSMVKKNSPPTRVKIVIDEVVHGHNPWLSTLEKQFPNHFQSVFVQKVWRNVETQFPKYKKLLEVIFQNAEGGNPAIASDVYRLVGPLFGRDPIKYPFCFAYSDVDTFCASLPHAYGEGDPLEELCSRLNAASYLNALLALSREDILSTVAPHSPSLVIGRQEGRNDVIKVRIRDPQSAKRFALEIFEQLEMCLPPSPKALALTYQRCLYAFQTRQGVEASFQAYLDWAHNTIYKHTQETIYTTGPGLLDTLEQHQKSYRAFLYCGYPGADTFGWNPAFALDYDNGVPLIATQRTGRTNPTTEKKVSEELNFYKNLIVGACYFRRFGEDRPFFKRLIQYLRDHSFFSSVPYQTLVQEYYAAERQKSPQLTPDQWVRSKEAPELKPSANRLTKEDSPFVKIECLLRGLGLKIDGYQDYLRAALEAVLPKTPPLSQGVTPRLPEAGACDP